MTSTKHWLSSIAVAAATAMFLGAACAAASADDHSYNVRTETAQGAKLAGPGKVRFTNINPLRYSIKFSVNSKDIAGPTIPTQFLPSTQAAAKPSPAPNPAPTKTPIGAPVVPTPTPEIVTQLDNVAKVEADASAAKDLSAQLSQRIDSVLDSHADQDMSKAASEIKTDGAYVAASAALSKVTAAGSADDTLLVGAQAFLDKNIGTLPAADYKKLSDALTKARQDITALAPTASLVAALDAQSLQRSASDDCSSLSGTSGRTTTATLQLTQADSKQPDISDDVTIVCQSRLAVSAGFLFSSLQQNTFSAVTDPGSAGVAASAHVRATSSANPRAAPFAFVHERLGNGATFGTFGIGVASGTANTAVDYALGVSFSPTRIGFITIGAHYGQVSTFAPGFSPGTVVPVNSAVPTVNHYQVGGFLAISFGTQ